METILARLEPAVRGTFNTAGPGYLAFIPGGGIYSAALADYLALAVNRYVGVAKAAPALAQIEETAVAWLAEFAGCPSLSRGVLTTGGSLSNLIAVITAREAKLGEDFSRGVLYVSSETHASVAKAARLAGFPARAVRKVAVDARRCLLVGELERAIDEDRAAGRTPFLVVVNVGTTNTGAIDPLEEVIPLARKKGLWVHADAAYGGFFAAVPELAKRLAPMNGCDSVTLDPHKGLFLPYGTGCLLVRDEEALVRAHATDAEYLRDVAADHGRHNFTDLSPELSRDFRGLRVWLPFMLHGTRAFKAALAEKRALALFAHHALASDARFNLPCPPDLSVVAFRLRGASDEGNAELLERVNARRRVFLSSTRLDERLTLRLCVLSFRTHEDRVAEAVRALREEASAIR